MPKKQCQSIQSKKNDKLEGGAMPNVMAALPNVAGALSVQRRKVWLTPTTTWRAVTLPRRDTS